MEKVLVEHNGDLKSSYKLPSLRILRPVSVRMYALTRTRGQVALCIQGKYSTSIHTC